MERARAFAPPAGRSRGECGSGIALTRSPARPKIGAVHRGGGETSGSSSLGKQDRRAGDEIVPMHPRWERILRGESAYASVPAHVPDGVRIGSEPVAVQVLQRAVQGTGRRNAQVVVGRAPASSRSKCVAVAFWRNRDNRVRVWLRFSFFRVGVEPDLVA